jgi:hypothetical protein
VKRRVRAWAVLLVAVGLTAAALGACGDDGGRAGAAGTCDDLVQRAAKVAQQVVDEYRDKNPGDLDHGTADDPFPELTHPFAPFEARANELHCDRGELRRLACEAYQGIQATGPAMEEFLAALTDDCP